MEELNTLVGASEETTYPSHIINLKNAFKAAIGNSDFIGDSKKVEKIILALTPVDPAVRVKAQLLTNAWKRLRAEAAEKAEDTNDAYVAPTQSQVDLAVSIGMKVWRDKQK